MFDEACLEELGRVLTSVASVGEALHALVQPVHHFRTWGEGGGKEACCLYSSTIVNTTSKGSRANEAAGHIFRTSYPQKYESDALHLL